MATMKRTLRLMTTSEGQLLRIEKGEEIFYYMLTPIPTQEGRAYHLKKVVTGPGEYNVIDGGLRGIECDCPAGTYKRLLKN